MNIAADMAPGTRAVEELMVERAKASYARLPMLEVVFDRFSLSLPQVLRSYLGGMADVSLTRIDYLSCQEAQNQLPETALIAVTEAAPWNGTIAAVMHPDLLFNVIEVTFGGRMGPRGVLKERGFTGIEKRVGKSFCETVLDELMIAFEKVAPATFTIDHLETSPKGMLLAPPASPCIRAVLRIELDDRVGEMSFLLPNTAFERVVHILAQNFTGGQLGGDSDWRSDMVDMLESTSVEMAAVMAQATIPMRNVLAWTPGQVLDLGIEIDAPVTLNCAGKDIATAQVGRRKNGRVALQFAEKLYETEKELTDVLRD